MTRRIRIGNQTAIAAADPLEPFAFAVAQGFDAFEWFADKKCHQDGSTSGWDEPDFDPEQRQRIRDTGLAHGLLYTVHAPWQANPLQPDGVPLLCRSLAFAQDIGADLVNLHLYMDAGPRGYALALRPVLAQAQALGLRLSIENTPLTTPDDFNRTFACLQQLDGFEPGRVGLCLDLGHANLCRATHNDYVRFLDEVDPALVPLIHLHVHENYGDSDSHLTLFTGPSRQDDRGIRALLERLRRRAYAGALILEQWPKPPTLLVEAATRLRALLQELDVEDKESDMTPP